MENKPSYYSVIPAEVRYCKDLSSFSKIIYSEISCLLSAKGYCFASNEYFANLFGVNVRTIQRSIKELESNGFIFVTYEENLRGIIPIVCPSITNMEQKRVIMDLYNKIK